MPQTAEMLEMLEMALGITQMAYRSKHLDTRVDRSDELWSTCAELMAYKRASLSFSLSLHSLLIPVNVFDVLLLLLLCNDLITLALKSALNRYFWEFSLIIVSIQL